MIRLDRVAEVARVATYTRLTEVARVAEAAKVAAVAAAERATEVARVAAIAAAARTRISDGTRGYEIRFGAVIRPHGGGTPPLPFAYSRSSVSLYMAPPLGDLFLLCIPDTCNALQVTKTGAIKISIGQVNLGEVAVESLEASGFKYYGVTKGRGYMKCQQGANAVYNTIVTDVQFRRPQGRTEMTLQSCTGNDFLIF